jgi:hypothetical protein
VAEWQHSYNDQCDRAKTEIEAQQRLAEARGAEKSAVEAQVCVVECVCLCIYMCDRVCVFMYLYV